MFRPFKNRFPLEEQEGGLKWLENSGAPAVVSIEDGM